MDDWKIIWNSFCDEVAFSVHHNNTELVFEKDIAVEFFRALDWYRLNKGLQEQYPIKFATSTHRADIALFVPDKDLPEIIVELKRPTNKKKEKDTEQLIDYMRQKSCSYGILLLGEKLEIYYIDYSTPEHEATLVETIKYQHDNEAARQLMEVLIRSCYSSAQMIEYCNKRVKINKSVEYWCSQDGKTEIMNIIIERSSLPKHLLETLRTTLQIEVKRKDGLTPVQTQKIEVTSKVEPVTKISTKKVVANKKETKQPKVWLIPASPKLFNHKACFEEQGQIYWTQHNNFQVGDTGYIYYSDPKRCIVDKFEVIASELPYSSEMDAEIKYYKNPLDFEKGKQHNRFFIIKKIGESTSGKLTFKNMIKNGMNGAPMGACEITKPKYAELKKYIEKNF